MVEGNPRHGFAYGAVGDGSNPTNTHAHERGRSGLRRTRLFLAIGGTLCLVAAHCLCGFLVYHQWHGDRARLASTSAFLRKMRPGIISNLETSLVRKSTIASKQQKPVTHGEWVTVVTVVSSPVSRTIIQCNVMQYNSGIIRTEISVTRILISAMPRHRECSTDCHGQISNALPS